ncbi:precorrin-2 C(20)-methyltransferase [Desulfovibrio sp.]
MKQGTLYGLGIGPGDPELMTLKAVRLLNRVDVVLGAASPKNDASRALEIAAPHLPTSAEILRLDFPMTRDRAVQQAAWRTNAEKTRAVLDSGRDAAFLTLGDPLTYSTFGYLLRTLAETGPMPPVEIVPGITSYQAAAARVARPLMEAEESLIVIPGVCSAEKLEKLLSCADNAVILKAYRNLPEIRETLSRLDLAGSSVFVSRVGLPGELVHEDLDDAPDSPHYFSLILVRKQKT